MNHRIEPISAGIAVPLSVMHRACFPDDPWDAAALEHILALSGMFGYLGWQAEAPTGFILARDLGDEVEILSLGVLPGSRRRGVGQNLLAAVLAEATRRRRYSVVLEVAEENEAARHLYTDCGFTGVGRRPHYYRRAGRIADGLILRRNMRSSPSSE